MSLFRIIPDRHDVLQDDNMPLEKGSLKEKIYNVVFKSDTAAGKIFDVTLVVLIIANIGLLMLESIKPVAARHAELFRVLDYFFMAVFTIEYFLRLYCVRVPKRYATSFYGTIDLLAILPSYLEFIFPQSHMLMIVRSFRLLRVFRVFGLVAFLNESRVLVFALLRSAKKIMVFLFFVILMTIFLGSLMYVIEYEHNPGFNSIPQSIYWAIVTITTVGYGDVAPQTVIGKFIASFIMILGYAIIAVPTGIMSSSIIREEKKRSMKNLPCPRCGARNHNKDAIYCDQCGENLTAKKTS